MNTAHLHPSTVTCAEKTSTSMCIHVYTSIYTYTYIYTHMCTYIYTDVLFRMNEYILHTYLHTCTKAYVHAYVQTDTDRKKELQACTLALAADHLHLYPKRSHPPPPQK